MVILEMRLIEGFSEKSFVSRFFLFLSQNLNIFDDERFDVPPVDIVRARRISAHRWFGIYRQIHLSIWHISRNFSEKEPGEMGFSSDEFSFSVALTYLISIFSMRHPISWIIEDSNTNIYLVIYVDQKRLLLKIISDFLGILEASLKEN